METSYNIEKSIAQLEEIVRSLGDDTVSLDKSLELYTNGVKLAEECLEKLKLAEQVVEEHRNTNRLKEEA